MRPDYAPMVWIGGVTGLRWGDVAGLRVGHVDLLRRSLTVQEQVAPGRSGRTEISAPKSEAGNRTLRFPPQLADVIGAHLASRQLTGADHDRLLFPAPKTENRPLDYGNWRLRIWLPAVATAQLEGRGFHDLRRANATAMVRQNVDPRRPSPGSVTATRGSRLRSTRRPRRRATTTPPTSSATCS